MAASRSERAAEKRQVKIHDAERYSEAVLRRKLGWGSQDVAIHAAQGGGRSIVYFVQPSESAPVVLRAFTDAKSFLRHRRALDYAGRLDLPTPKILHASGGWLTTRRYGHRFLATEIAPGSTLEHFGGDRAKLADSLGRAMARLHGAEAKRWGDPGALRRKPYGANLRRGVERRIEKLAGPSSDFGAENIKALRQWFYDRLEAFDAPSSFQLCHHHLQSDDILYEESSGISTLIDCASLQFSRASRDLAALRRLAIFEQDKHWDGFIKTYFTNSPPSRRDEYDREMPFFDMFIGLSRARRLVPSHGEGKPVFDIEGEANQIRDRLMRMISS